MLMPKKVKYRKQQRGTNKGMALRGFTIQVEKGTGNINLRAAYPTGSDIL